MSIPPLVCSTPPPPDQCEDDKDHEDFDLHYNLSQDDDDENYDYGSFTTFNHCQKSPEKHNTLPIVNETKPIENDFKHLHNGTGDFIHGNGTTPEKASPEKRLHEEEVIEDLNLEVETDIFEKPVAADQINEAADESEKNITDIELSNVINELIIPSVSQNVDDVEIEDISPPDTSSEFAIEAISDAEHTDQPSINIDELIEKESNDLKPIDSRFLESGIKPEKELTEVEASDNVTFEFQIDEQTHLDKDKSLETDVNTDKNRKTEGKQEDDDDFGDFDDFQFATTSISNNPLTVIDNCDDPWNNNEATDDDFGDFKATFTQSENEQNLFSESKKLEEHSNQPTMEENLNQDIGDDNDDFGDFDDFKSSAAKDPEEVEFCHRIPVLNLQSSESENQIMESINKVLCSIFVDEISEPVPEFEGKLETSLGVPWGHLLEVDTRQPYIVNWNNSLGQKTLLKALCIDSRNILFGPKWSHNMPKYAANLTTAPLQPQKQSGARAEPFPQEKTAPNTTWSDPFSSDGQEFTYAEALLLDLEHLMATLDQMANQQPTLKLSEFLSQAGSIGNDADHLPIEIGPTDLDVFEASTSTKPDKIYSSTLNVQPIRQISLPDTHIFTPTDSETPRSKTIHYESPSILLPQTSIGSVSISEKVTPPVCGPTTADVDDEYWEFQDFQGTAPLPSKDVTVPDNADIPSSSLPSTSSATYASQVLQPIRVEPTMPTLNWPEPGEVKETFEDFSEFVSNSAWTNKEEASVSQTINEPNKSELLSGSASAKVTPVGTSDDDFDTFQSALPPKADTIHSTFPKTDTFQSAVSPKVDTFQSAVSPKTVSSDFTFNSLGSHNVITQTIPQKTTDLNYSSPINNQKSDVISFPNISRPRVPVNLVGSNATKEPHKTPSVHHTQALTPSLLQPTTANTARPSQNSNQILQPLSLESYSQINWPNPGIDLQDLSRFNPVETLHSLKSDLSANSSSKGASPVHSHKASNQSDDDWGEFVSSKPKPQQSKKPQTFDDDDEWSEFVSSPSVKPVNGLNTISLNVHTNLSVQKSANLNKNAQKPFDIPTLNYITPKANNHQTHNDRHFQNL